MWVKYGRFEFDTKDVVLISYQKPRKPLAELEDDDDDFGGHVRYRDRERKEGYIVSLRSLLDPVDLVFITPDQREDLLRKMKVTE